MNVLILGATGAIGYTIFRTFYEDESFNVWGTIRNANGIKYFPVDIQKKIINNINVIELDQLIRVFEQTKPDLIINCTGLIKQLNTADNPLIALPINALFPHNLVNLCSLTNTRLIQLSTDCVFSGRKGMYTENDISDAEDLYGKSKFIGEVVQSKNAITLRTSTIGHELNTNYGLLEWFLSQHEKVKGYVKAIYSGIPSIELALIIKNYVIPNNNLSGLYHVAANPINKYDLLNLIAEIYNKKIIIEKDENISIDRSLNGVRFKEQTGYKAPDWPILIEKMHQSQKLMGLI